MQKSWTKRELINRAFEILSMSGENLEVGAGEVESALHVLDAMMALWNGKGVRLGYPVAFTPGGSLLDQDSRLDPVAVEPVCYGLAVRLADEYGRQLGRTTLRIATDGFATLQGLGASPGVMVPRPGTPAGAGNNRGCPGYDDIFLPNPPIVITTGHDGKRLF